MTKTESGDHRAYFNSEFPATSNAGGYSWPFDSILRGLHRRCKNVKEVAADPGRNVRGIAATDTLTDLNFVAVLTHAPGAPNNIVELLYGAAFVDMNLTDADAGRINNVTYVSTAYVDDGNLFLMASARIERAFDAEFFDEQLSLYLQDLRSAALSIARGQIGAHHGPAMFAQTMLSGATTGLGNRPRTRAQAAEFVRRMSEVRTCRACGGSGRRWLAPCSACGGGGST